jgi:hypothetical protein
MQAPSQHATTAPNSGPLSDSNAACSSSKKVLTSSNRVDTTFVWATTTRKSKLGHYPKCP